MDNLNHSFNKFNENLIDRPYLPDCWSDDKRMNVLFNAFRVRNINPEGWDLKMNFWINLINKWCLYERKVVFTINDCRHTFVRDGKLPQLDCIKLVLSHMRRQQKILFKNELLDLQKKSTLTNNRYGIMNWTLNSLIMKPISYGWNLFTSANKNYNGNDYDKIIPTLQEDLPIINVEILQIISESIESYIKNLNTKCINYDKFIINLNQNVFKDKNIDKNSLNLALINLEIQNKLKIQEETNFKYIRFYNNYNQQHQTNEETDLILLKLEMLKEILEKETDELEKQIKKLDDDVHMIIKNNNNNKEKALLLLKRKKRLEKRLNEKDSKIDNIEILYTKLLECDTQQLILNTFKLASNFLKKNSMDINNIETIMDELDEQINNQTLINDEVNRPINSQQDALFEIEAEKELNDILNENDTDEKSTQNDNESMIELLNKLSVVENDNVNEEIGDSQNASSNMKNLQEKNQAIKLSI